MDSDDFVDFFKFVFGGGCIIFVVIVIMFGCFLGMSLASIPFEQTKCNLASQNLEVRFEFFGGCFVKDQKTGVFMNYDKWEQTNGTLDIK